MGDRPLMDPVHPPSGASKTYEVRSPQNLGNRGAWEERDVSVEVAPWACDEQSFLNGNM